MRYAQVEEKIKTMVEEIVRRILRRKLLVVFTGGKIGVEKSLEQLEEIVTHHNSNIDLLFSIEGSKIHDIESIKRKLQADKVYIEGKDRVDDPKDYIGVVFAVLTRNTVSKAVNLILDGDIVEIMINALMLGIPVVAPRDAADIESVGWGKLGYMWANNRLKSAFSRNLSILEDYGVHMCDADNLSSNVEDIIFGEKTKNDVKTSIKTSVVRINKNLITRKDLIPYLGEKHEIYIPSNVLLTPLAQDIIRDYELKIIRE